MSAVALDDDDNIYIGTGHKQGSQECYLYSLDSNGTLNWKYDVGYGKSVVGAPAIGPSGNIYFIVVSYSAGNRGIYLHAIDSLGGVGWISDNLFRGGAEEQFDIEEWTPAISSQEVIYASVTGGLYAFSQEGTALWSWTEPAYYTKFSSAAISSDETIYINVDERDAGSGGLYAFSSSGSQEWQYPISSAIYFSSPVIGGDGTIYFGRGSPSGTNDSYIYALNPDGEFLWKFYTGLVVVYAPSIGSDGTIYAGTTAKGGSREAGQGGIFFALNSNGEERWRYDTSADQMEFYEDNLAQADIYNSPAIGDDGTIYFASEGRYFYAFDPDGIQYKSMICTP